MKKWFIVYFLLVISLVYPQFSSSAEELKLGDFWYEVVGEEIKITGYNGKAETVVIPDEIDGKIVTTIDDYAFKYKTVKHVTLPAHLVTIEDSAFMTESLETVNIPITVKTIGPSAFSGTSIKEITLPEGLAIIDRGAFSGTDLKEVTIPSTVKKIDHGAFGAVPLEKVVIKDGVEIINSSVFAHTNLTTVTLPNSVKEIGDKAFSHTPLTAIQLSKNVEKIGKQAFAYTNLPSIHFPASLEVVAEEAFYQAPLKEVTFEHTKQPLTIGKRAFASTKLARIVFPEGLVSIGDSAFLRTQLKEAIFPTTLQSIGYQSFANLALEKIELREGLQTIGEKAFYHNHLRHVVVPTTVTNLGSKAFGDQDLEDLPPVIAGAKEQTIVAGAPLNSRKDITFMDEEDGDLAHRVVIQRPSVKIPGRYETIYSVTDSAQQTTTFTRIVYVLPRAVTLSATSKSNAIQLYWNPKDHTDSYKVYVYDMKGKLVRTAKANKSSMKISQLKAGTAYRVKVRAYVKTADKTLFSDDSNVVTLITLPAKPALTVTALSKGFKASWKTVPTATNYDLEYSLKKDFNDVFKTKLSSKTTAKNVRGLKKGKTYYVRIRSIQKYNKKTFYSEWSTVKKVVAK